MLCLWCIVGFSNTLLFIIPGSWQHTLYIMGFGNTYTWVLVTHTHTQCILHYIKVANPYGLSVRTTEFDLFHSLTAVGPKSYGYKIFWVNIFFYRVKMAETRARLVEASRESRETRRSFARVSRDNPTQWTTLAKSRDNTREVARCGENIPQCTGNSPERKHSLLPRCKSCRLGCLRCS